MDEGIHLATITIHVYLDQDGDEVLDLEQNHELSIARLLGILDICRDMILHPPVDDEDE